MDANEIRDYSGPFTEETFEELGTFFTNLPEKVRLVVHASVQNSCTEENTVDLCQVLADRFEMIECRNRPRVADFPWHPIIAVNGVDEKGKDIDYRIRFFGHPAWYQINSLIGAIQAVSLRGMTLDAKTRIQLSRLKKEVRIETFTTPENESGVPMATLACNLAVLNPNIRTFVCMINDFPDLVPQYSIYSVPHTIINQKHHLQGVYSEEKLLKAMARAVKDD
ncbi:MAG: thioredoxin family protein [Anaerolineae bacterium]